MIVDFFCCGKLFHFCIRLFPFAVGDHEGLKLMLRLSHGDVLTIKINNQYWERKKIIICLKHN